MLSFCFFCVDSCKSSFVSCSCSGFLYFEFLSKYFKSRSCHYGFLENFIRELVTVTSDFFVTGTQTYKKSMKMLSNSGYSSISIEFSLDFRFS